MSVLLNVAKRDVRPRSLRKKLRHSGQIPAIVYGYKIESTPIACEQKDLFKILREHGANTVITLAIDGKKINTLAYKIQFDTFTHEMRHVEFLAVNMKEATEVEAEIELVGEAPGVKVGGTLNQNIYSVIVSATPDKLPERVQVDISKLEIGQAIVVGDLPINPDYDIITDPEEQILSIIEKGSSTEEETSEEAIEPQVIGEKSEE